LARFESLRTVTVAALVAELGQPTRMLGDPERRIRVLASLDEAGADTLCFLKADEADPYRRLGPVGAASVVMADGDALVDDLARERTLILVPDPRRYFIRAFQHLIGIEPPPEPGIHAGAHVDPAAELPPDASIGPGAVVEAGVSLGAGCVIHGGAKLYSGTHMGARVVIQANTVLGAVGQSYERDDDGEFLLMPHFAGIRVGDDARIGANSTIVRGTLQDTEIGPASVLGNQVNVGHNVTIGSRCHIGAGSIVCGSSRVGDDSWLSPGVIIKSVALGNNVMVGTGSVVTRAVADDKFVTGFPAREAVKINDYNMRTGR
jgi:UDP-3-O-[3-hydroxymyristoyl] glucosamine N-acyltransferase